MSYTEDSLVEQPAIGLFAELGWETTSASEETFGPSSTLGRETKGEVVLISRLRTMLCKLNPALPPEAISNALDELTRDRSAMSFEAANREIYQLLKDGIMISIPDHERGGQVTERLRVVDWVKVIRSGMRGFMRLPIRKAGPRESHSFAWCWLQRQLRRMACPKSARSAQWTRWALSERGSLPTCPEFLAVRLFHLQQCPRAGS